MDKPKIPIEEVLIKPVRGITNFRDLEGFDSPSFQLLLKFLHEVATARSSSKTTSIMLAWDTLTDNEQSRLTEHYSKVQLVNFGLALCCVMEAGATLPGSLSFLMKFMKDLRRPEEDSEDK